MNGRKPLVWLTSDRGFPDPPFTPVGQEDAGTLLRLVQEGESLGMPGSEPMPGIGRRCHQLRVPDAGHNWRVVYRTDADAIVIAHVYPKTTRKTPKAVIALCKARLARYDAAAGG